MLASLAVGILISVAFLRIESSSDSPMVPLALFQSRAFSGANLLTLFLYAAIGIFFFLLPLNLIQVQGYSPAAAGGAVLPLIVVIFLLSRWSGGLVSRYGARLPLILGPLITGFGFFLCSVPSVGGSYWVTFFPAVLVLGLGMAVSVAPLTTVVMEAVDPDRVGTASGINNAVARVAGLLAIAVLGVAVVTAFSHQLNRQLLDAQLPAGVLSELQSNEARLAALKPPAGLQPALASTIKASITSSFVDSFRLVMWICTVLAFASSGAAWRMIPDASDRRIAPATSAGRSHAEPGTTRQQA